MKYLTTKKKKVDRFYNENTEQAKLLKNDRLELFKQEVNEDNDIFDGKKMKLLDEIVFRTVNTGVCHFNLKNFKVKIKVGRTTVASFNKLLRVTGQYIIARYRTSLSNCAGLIYIDTNHYNFYENMQFLFDMDMLEVDLYLAKVKKIEVAAQGVVISEHDKQTELIEKYATNKYQTAFFKYVHDMPCDTSVKRFAYKMALKVADSSKVYLKATAAFFGIIRDIKSSDLVLNTAADIVKVFEGALTKALNYDIPVKKVEEIAATEAPFYNWLEQR